MAEREREQQAQREHEIEAVMNQRQVVYQPRPILNYYSDEVQLEDDPDVDVDVFPEEDDLLDEIPDFANMDRQGVLTLLQRLLNATDVLDEGPIGLGRGVGGALSDAEIDELPRGVLSSNSEFSY